MLSILRFAIAVLVLSISAAATTEAHAGKRTVCTITVNSTDEREAFRQHLPAGEFRFVELVERGRPDWLATACRQRVQCDLLVISGHFNGNHFFSDQLAINEHLPVAEMERAACSDACPGLFSKLKEVYLFGCDTLNAATVDNASAEIVASLVKAGRPRAEAERVTQLLADRHIESNRDVMRRVFSDTPAIYGFSSVAPLGATAGPILQRYLRSASPAEVGSGQPNRKLLGQFSAHAMTVTSGMRDKDALAAHRAEVCRFVDDRLSTAQKLEFVHGILRRDAPQARMFFERIERLLAVVDAQDRRSPEVAAALERIAADGESRDRYLAFARNVPTASTRARMTEVARALGWLSDEAHRDEQAKLIADLLSPQHAISTADVQQICALNRNGDYDGEAAVQRQPAAPLRSPGQSAALACLGSVDDRARMLEALSSPNERDIEMAEVYFHHRPIADANELGLVTAAIARMAKPEAKVRSLHALARQPLTDTDGLGVLARLFPVAESVMVQRAIANVFIRADHRAIATPELVRVFRDHRKPSEAGDVIDVLIRRLERAVSVAGAPARS